MKTAVNYLVEQLDEIGFHTIVSQKIIDKAKELEKEQMIEFAKDCIHKDDCFFIVEQYYNETFKSE